MTRSPNRTGFTLVETALALLAISLGLLGIFGLARHGLKAGGDTENETRCAILADTVFETLKAKNDELSAKKESLYNWWVYWLSYLSQSAQVSLYLPPMSEISGDGQPISLAVGKHDLMTSTTFTEVKWNPVYTLTLNLNGVNLTNPDSVYEAYERGQIDVTFSVLPGTLQSGAETRTYSTVLYYSGGLP